MIKYKIQTGDKVLNTKAQTMREQVYKPALKGMHCRKCTSDTTIEFLADTTNHPIHQITACCPDFHQRIKEKLKIGL